MRLITLISACLVSLAASAEGKLSLNTGFEYSNGDYGGVAETEIWMVPIGLKYQNGPMALRLSTAWLRISGPGGITPDGEPVAGGGVNATEQGMGDVSTSLTWTLLDEGKYPFGLDAGAKVKFGTADEKKYLGTGENDYSLQTEIFKPIGPWFPSLKIGYSWKGDPAGMDYRNVWYGSVGADYRLSKTYSVGAYYDRRQKLTANGQPVSEAMAYLNTRLNEHSRLNAYLISGFSEASPDWGAGVSLGYIF